jgi:endogenous inhibitor of DNA gyrase (YacG/DUF329 family)
VETNYRPACPFNFGQQFESASCAPPFLSATVARLWRPTCGKKGMWFSGDFGPFCSQRCKLVDLGKWLGGKLVISESLRPEHFAAFAELPPGDHRDRPELGA